MLDGVWERKEMSGPFANHLPLLWISPLFRFGQGIILSCCGLGSGTIILTTHGKGTLIWRCESNSHLMRLEETGLQPAFSSSKAFFVLIHSPNLSQMKLIFRIAFSLHIAS